jgi:hypothetical protein
MSELFIYYQHQMHELIISLIPCLLLAHSKLIV